MDSDTNSGWSAQGKWIDGDESLKGKKLATTAAAVARRSCARMSHIRGVKLAVPKGAFYVFVRVDAFYGKRKGVANSLSFCEALLEERKVACVPGSAFGDDRYIRLSYATSTDKIQKGCARIKEFAEGL